MVDFALIVCAYLLEKNLIPLVELMDLEEQYILYASHNNAYNPLSWTESLEEEKPSTVRYYTDYKYFHNGSDTTIRN